MVKITRDRLYLFCRVPFVTNGVVALQRVIDQIIRDNNIKDIYAYINNIIISRHDENLRKFMGVAKHVNLTFNQKYIVKILLTFWVTPFKVVR